MQTSALLGSKALGGDGPERSGSSALGGDGLPFDETSSYNEKNHEFSEIAGQVESVIKKNGLDMDTIQQHYTL